MALLNSDRRFGAVAQTLHWVIAGLIILQYVLVELAEEAEHARKTNPAAAMEQLALMARHKSFGITILALALLRLLWRWRSPPPAFPVAMPHWQIWVARALHYAFYALLILLPVTGWLMSSAANRPVSWFGLFTLPDLVAPDKSLRHTLGEVHETAFSTLFVLAVVHVAAALKHHWFDRDDVLRRMLPWGA